MIDKVVKFICLSLLFSLLSGCSYFSTPAFLKVRDTEYLKARSVPPLRIPPGISSSSFNNDYPIPYRAYPPSSKVVSLAPPGLNN